MNETLLTVKEAAECLKLSEFTIRKHSRSGKITAVKDHGGKMWRIPTAELKKYMGVR